MNIPLYTTGELILLHIMYTITTYYYYDMMCNELCLTMYNPIYNGIYLLL